MVIELSDGIDSSAIEITVAQFEEWLEREAESLQEALAARRVVEQDRRALLRSYAAEFNINRISSNQKAFEERGIRAQNLMGRYGLTEREAFMRIRRQSRHSRRPMREVAEEILWE